MANNNNNKIPNVPNLRFPEFSGEWKKTKVSDLLEFFSTNSLSWDQLDYEKGEIRNLHYGLIHKGLPTLIDVKNNSLPFIKVNCIPRNYTLCMNGDIVFADASEDTNDVAKAVEINNCCDKKIVCGLHTIHGRDKEKETVIGYKGYAFASFVFHKQTKRIAQGTKIYSINTRNFSKIFISVPLKEEQAKIVALLSSLDERITTQNKIIDNLKTLIKGLTQLVITKSKANTIIKDCLECYSSTLQESHVTEKGSYPAYGANGIVGYTESNQISGDAILIIKDGSGVGGVSYANGKFSVTGTLNYLMAKQNYSSKYIYFCLMAFDFKPYKMGMTIPHIYFKDYGKAKIYCPSYIKQKSIAKELSNLETKIKIEKKILFLQIKQKSHLLQQMFI